MFIQVHTSSPGRFPIKKEEKLLSVWRLPYQTFTKMVRDYIHVFIHGKPQNTKLFFFSSLPRLRYKVISSYILNPLEQLYSLPRVSIYLVEFIIINGIISANNLIWKLRQTITMPTRFFPPIECIALLKSETRYSSTKAIFDRRKKNNLKREKKVRVEKLFITSICYNIYKVCKL